MSTTAEIIANNASIIDINNLSLPELHKETLMHMVSKLQDFPIVEDIILFGSCAKQDASQRSDIDIAVVVSEPISPEEEWNIDNYIRYWDANLPCDVIFIPASALEQAIEGETVIRPILREGVRLGELLHQR
jgi:predicted nucleotidyltransferase